MCTQKMISPRETLYDFDQCKQNQSVFSHKVCLIITSINNIYQCTERG